jgi:AraC-like DNA-binding protein
MRPQPRARIEGNTVWIAEYAPSMLGRNTAVQSSVGTACESAIMIEFKPGAAQPIFGLPLDELTDRIVSLEQLWGNDGARLCEQLQCAQGEARRIEQLEQALLERMAVAPEASSARLARRAVRLLEGGQAPARIEALSASLGVTARHLRRAFREAVGVGPKEFARMVRLRRALRTVDSAPNWSELATSSGYYDQAHLIAEFRMLVGTTPGALQKRRKRLGLGARTDSTAEEYTAI